MGDVDSGQVWVKEYSGHNLPLKVGIGSGGKIIVHKTQPFNLCFLIINSFYILVNVIKFNIFQINSS